MRVSISLKSAQALLDMRAGAKNFGELRSAIAHATRVRPGIKKAKAAKAKKVRARSADTKSIRAAVVERADGVCECGCRTVFSAIAPGELDHFFGRSKAPQSEANTWLLRRDCHGAKTRNNPSAEWWLTRFITHAQKWGYRAEATNAQNRLSKIRIMAELEVAS